MEAVRGRDGFDGAAGSREIAAQEISEYLESEGIARNFCRCGARDAGSFDYLR